MHLTTWLHLPRASTAALEALKKVGFNWLLKEASCRVATFSLCIVALAISMGAIFLSFLQCYSAVLRSVRHILLTS